jgi:fucose 4-O-acetylase-like acetyltransferase
MGARFAWMDQARGVAIILVIVHHSMTWTGLFGLEVPVALVAFDDIVSPFRMPLLMFLSGMLVTGSLAKAPGVYFAGKARAIAWPYLLWSVIFLSWTGTLAIVLVPNILLFPPTYLWYLWFLFAYYVAAWVIARLRIPLLPVAVLSLAASAFAPEDYRISRFFFLFTFFAFGWWWSSSGIVTRGSPRTRAMAIATGLAAGVVVAGITVAGHPTRYEAGYAWGVLALIAALALMLPQVRSGRRSAALEFVGRNSIVYYVTHYTLIWALDVLLVDTWGWSEPWVVWAAGVVVAVICASALCLLRQRWAPIGWLFVWPAGTARVRASA